jgi:RNA polymerase sigma-70 factor, ECF subfamily
VDDAEVGGTPRKRAETSADAEWSRLLALDACAAFSDEGRSAIGRFVENWPGDTLGDIDRAVVVDELCDRIRDSLLADAQTRAHPRDVTTRDIEDFLTEILARVSPSSEALRVAPAAESGWSRIYTALIKDPEDASAWRELEARVRAMARSHFWRLTAAIEDDLAGETVARVFVSLGNAHGAETFGAFVYGHFRNVKKGIINRLRRNDLPLGDVDISGPSVETPDSRELAALRGCVDELEDRARRAVDLAYWQDASSEQIALALGVTNVNARQILWRAKGRLRRCVQAYLRGVGRDTAASLESV